MDQITKEQAIEAAGGSAAELARVLGVKHQAVQQWPAGKPIPQLRQYQLRERMPHKFGKCMNGGDVPQPATTEARAA
jgi:hypothetical protein